MSKKTKKDLVYLLILLSIMFAGCFLIFDIIVEIDVKDQNMQNASFKEKIKRFMDIDSCADDGYCKEGIIVHDKNGKPYLLNKNTCIENNGKWNDETKYCNFR